MRKRGICSVVGGAIVTAALLLAPSASAATLLGDYQLQGTRASSGPGATLTDIGTGSNPFQTEPVFGASRQALVFPKGNGLKLTPTGLSPTASNSVITSFRFTDLTSYRRILDYSNGTSDGGIYVHDAKAAYYNVGAHESTTPKFTPNTYATVAVTVTDAPPTTRIYVDGALATSFGARDPIVGDTLRFFKDNDVSGVPNEDSAGAVSCIRVYSGVLTDAEIAGVGASPTCGTVAATPAATKCKKHKKKKRSADSAKKKKCKKHKKKKH
jgi:Concanavalin A-like lectin/glucanases superfamily